MGYQYFSRGLYSQARNALRGSMRKRPNLRAAKYYCLSLLPDSVLRGIKNLLGKS